MRAVTAEEITQIAAGLAKQASPRMRSVIVKQRGRVHPQTTDLPPVVVTGHPPGSGGGFPPSWGGGGGTPTPPGAGATIGAGDGGGGGVDWSNFSIDQGAIDHDNKDLASQINHKGDHDSTEYLGFVYVNAKGQVVESPLVKGGDDVNVGNALQQLGINADQVVDMVHNHPVDRYGGGDPYSNASKLNYAPSAHDWEAHDVLIDNGADPNFGLYIDGPDGVTRYYDGSDRTDPSSGHAPHGRVI